MPGKVDIFVKTAYSTSIVNKIIYVNNLYVKYLYNDFHSQTLNITFNEKDAYEDNVVMVREWFHPKIEVELYSADYSIINKIVMNALFHKESPLSKDDFNNLNRIYKNLCRDFKDISKDELNSLVMFSYSPHPHMATNKEIADSFNIVMGMDVALSVTNDAADRSAVAIAVYKNKMGNNVKINLLNNKS